MDGTFAQCLDEILRTIQHGVTAECPQGLDLVRAGDGDHVCAAPPGQLDGGGTDAPRGTGNQHCLSRAKFRTLQHVLRRPIGTGNCCKFGICPAALHWKNLRSGNLHEFREGAVEVRPHPDIVEAVEATRAHAGPNQDAPADEMGMRGTPGTHHLAAAVSSLNEGKGRCLVPAAVLAGIVLGIRRCLRTGGHAC